MKVIKITLLAGALLAGTGVASAQPQGARGPAAEVTRDQALARADQRFQRMDANRDGRVTAEELRQVVQARMARREERGGQRQDQLFERLDTNRDGQLSREEFAQRRALRGERRAARGMGGMDGPRGGRMAMRLLGEDGVLTMEEFRQQALRRFERLDANRDGRVSGEERRNVREQRRERRGARDAAPDQD
jgi:Ca2+-binding EF-hand superfamily protein